MGVSSSESHDLTAFYEMLTASFGVLSQNTGFYPSLDRIIETMLGPLNLGPGGGSYNEPISHLQRRWTRTHGWAVLTFRVTCILSFALMRIYKQERNREVVNQPTSIISSIFPKYPRSPSSCYPQPSSGPTDSCQ